jgi:hypothetical protein
MKKQILILGLLLFNIGTAFAYSNYPSIPDFKEVGNVTLYKVNDDNKEYYYNYDNKKFNGGKLLEKYSKMLDKAGLRTNKEQWKIYTTTTYYNDKVQNVEEDIDKIVYYDDKNNLTVTAEVSSYCDDIIDYKNRTKTLVCTTNHIEVIISPKTTFFYMTKDGTPKCENEDKYKPEYSMMVGWYCVEKKQPVQPVQPAPAQPVKTNTKSNILTEIGIGALQLLFGN